MTLYRSTQHHQRLLRRAATVRDMADRVLANGGEANYAEEKFWPAFAALSAALIDDLGVDGEELVDKIWVIADGELR